MNGHDTCQSCAYFKPQEGSAGGTCHRFPPQSAGENAPVEAHRWKFPWVSHHAWCGEFKPQTENSLP
jgi:hypothetical protein